VKQNGKLEAALTELLSRDRGLDRKKKALFISEARGLRPEIEQN
jgi:hypothetical protein